MKFNQLLQAGSNSCHRACMVAAGHMTEVPIEGMYSGVISLHGI